MASSAGLEMAPWSRWYSCELVICNVTFAHASIAASRASLSNFTGSNPLFASLIAALRAPLSHVDAAVDVDLLTGDVVAFRAEERDGARDLLRLSETAHRDLAEDLLAHVGRHLGEHV